MRKEAARAESKRQIEQKPVEQKPTAEVEKPAKKEHVAPQAVHHPQERTDNAQEDPKKEPKPRRIGKRVPGGGNNPQDPFGPGPGNAPKNRNGNNANNNGF